MKKDEYRDPLQYERVKERARKDSALRSLAGREIAPLPAVANPARHASASASPEKVAERLRRAVSLKQN